MRISTKNSKFYGKPHPLPFKSCCTPTSIVPLPFILKFPIVLNSPTNGPNFVLPLPPQSPLLNRIIIELTPRPKIRRPAQTPKDISNVIPRLDPTLKQAIPPSQNPLHDLDARQIDISNRRFEAALFGIEQVHYRRLSRIGAVEVRRRPHDDHPAEVRQVLDIPPQERLERRVVLLRRGAILPAPVCEELCCVLECFAQQRAAIIYIRRGYIAGYDARSLGADRVGGI